jgi:TonB-dependent receptor
MRTRGGAALKAMLLAGAVLPAGGAYAQSNAPATQPNTPATPSASVTNETPEDTQSAVPEPSVAPEGVDPATVDEVVVTGIRRTIQTSIQEKRTSQTIVDALSSEEIGELPALSIGEAIQTITGAATHRDKGGATEIAIRGLGPFLGASTFNGREATNGSGDRSVNFGQFPSELVNEIKIYKTQQANLIEGGVSGLIELETLRPLDYGKRRLQLEGKLNYSPYQYRIKDEERLGFRGTASYVDQFDIGGLGRIGVSLGYQRNDVTNPEEVYSSSTTWVACNANVTTLTANCPEITNAQGAAGAPFYLAPNSYTLRQIVEDDQRDAFFGAVQWRLNDAIQVNLDYQNSTRSFNERRNELNLSEGRRGVTNRVVDQEGRLLSFDANSTIETLSTFRNRTEDYEGGGLALSWRATDALTLSTDISYSKTFRSEFDRQTRLRSDIFDINNNRVQGVIPGNAAATQGQRVNYSFATGGDVPTIIINPLFDVRNHDLFSAAARTRRDEQVREDEIKAVRFDANLVTDFGFVNRIDAGVRFSERQYNDFDDRKEANLTDRALMRTANLACRTEFPQTDFLENATGNLIRSYATFDPVCLFRQLLGTEDPGRNSDLRSVLNRDVNEKVTAGYVMAGYETEAFGLPLSGNFGVRVVKTEGTSVGLRSALNVVNNPDGTIRLVSTGQFSEVVIENETTEVLPSLNAIFELQDEVLLRFGLFRALSRPAPSDLGSGRNVNLESGVAFGTLDDAIREITANGSPRLEPLMSWNGDVSLEWYPNRDSLFSAALYVKQFTGGFVPVAINETFVIGGQNFTTPVAQTQNTDDPSMLYGLELTLTHRFSDLPEPLDGLGFKISYNYAESDFETQDIRLGDILNPITGQVQPGFIPPAGIFGLSNHVLSAQVYYQIGDLDLAAIYNYRSNYYQQFVGGNNQLRYIRDTGTVDLRASYTLNKNISIRAEATNITDEPRYSDMPVQGNLREFNTYGPRYFAGVRFRY